MPGRNRKKSKATDKVFPRYLAATLFIGAMFALGYLWLDGRCQSLGREIEELEQTMDELHSKCLYEDSCWARMTSPRELEKALRRHNLHLAWPSRRQIVRFNSDDILAAMAETAGQSMMLAQNARPGNSGFPVYDVAGHSFARAGGVALND